MTRVGHLVRRFAASLRPRPPAAVDLEFVQRTLSAGELSVWERLGPADRAESVATARAAQAALGPNGEPQWIAAALLHDVGKSDTRLGPFGRSAATVIAVVAGHRRVRGWSNSVGRYVNHDELGAQKLQAAGSRPEAVIWARTHHRPDLWSTAAVALVPLEIARILAAADGEPVPQ